ncbi:MAG: hypothetical protein RLP14_08260 [Owenweeksia sp.]
MKKIQHRTHKTSLTFDLIVEDPTGNQLLYDPVSDHYLVYKAENDQFHYCADEQEARDVFEALEK